MSTITSHKPKYALDSADLSIRLAFEQYQALHLISYFYDLRDIDDISSKSYLDGVILLFGCSAVLFIYFEPETHHLETCTCLISQMCYRMLCSEIISS